MVVEYDGTGYFGFQYQPSRPTVQGELEKAIGRITGEEKRVHGAGRTDAGVHAIGQVVNVRLSTRLSLDRLARALNAVLPDDIAVRDLREVPAEFDARRSAQARTYRYCVWNCPVRSPLQARYTCHWSGPLDDQAMELALRPLIGRHDLAAFSGPIEPKRLAAAEAGTATVRRIESIVWTRQGNLLTMEITADAFLPHLVRNVVGVALRVGSGRMRREEVVELLVSRDRRLGPAPAPASGLCLVGVRYDPAWFGGSACSALSAPTDDKGQTGD